MTRLFRYPSWYLSASFNCLVLCLILLSTGKLVKSTEGVSDHSEEFVDKVGLEDLADENSNETPTGSKEEQLIAYHTPEISNQDAVFFYESFDDEANYKKNWILSRTTKADSSESKYDGQWTIVQTDDRIRGKFSHHFPHLSFVAHLSLASACCCGFLLLDVLTIFQHIKLPSSSRTPHYSL